MPISLRLVLPLLAFTYPTALSTCTPNATACWRPISRFKKYRTKTLSHGTASSMVTLNWVVEIPLSVLKLFINETGKRPPKSSHLCWYFHRRLNFGGLLYWAASPLYCLQTQLPFRCICGNSVSWTTMISGYASQRLVKEAVELRDDAIGARAGCE
ncbi:hypothetical protein HAX54_029008 [Datura stramonium]|uniref:Secreted protein n=1 Tax=Datura stramonium TaxID=4076 RepID=A0ABS8V567_DATST|nr:hypothetical protein [Datura stramonium]